MSSEAQVETLWGAQTPYQTRVKCGGFRIHIFWRGDRDPDMHDHPASFLTFPLVSYVEEVPHPWSGGHTEWRRVAAFRPHFRRAPYPHRVLGSFEGWDEVFRPDFTVERIPVIGTRPIITLGWWFKKRREWGFHTPDGWVPWREYVNAPGWESKP